MTFASGTKPELRRQRLWFQPNLRRLIGGGGSSPRQHNPSNRLSSLLLIRLHHKGNRKLSSTTGPIGPGPRPIITIIPNPKPIPIHILILSPKFQIGKFSRVAPTWAGGPAQENQVYAVAPKPETVVVVLCEFDGDQSWPENCGYSGQCFCF